jgi:hypothetical protein
VASTEASELLLDGFLQCLFRIRSNSVVIRDVTLYVDIPRGSDYRMDGKVFPLLGWVNNTEGDGPVSIAFSVRWEGYQSITSWTGSCDNDEDGPMMKVLWHLVRPEQEHAWERIIANSSVFRPGE